MLVGIFLLWLMYFSSIFMSLGDSYDGGTLNSIFESDFWIFSDSFLCLLFFVFLIFILYYYLYYYNNINNSIRLIVIYISQYFQNEFLENSKIKKTFGKSVSFFYSMHIFLLLLIFFFTYNKYYFGHSFIFNFIIFLIIIIKSFYNIYLIFHFRVKFIKDLKIFQVPLKKTIFLILSNLSIFFNILIIVISIYQIFLLFL